MPTVASGNNSGLYDSAGSSIAISNDINAGNVYVSGNITANNANITNNLTVGGNANVDAIYTDNYFYANGSPFAGGGGGNATLSGNLVGNLEGNGYGIANLTFVSGTTGTLGGLTVTGNISSGNLSTGNAQANIVSVSTTAGATVGVGQIAWNSSDLTFDMGLNNGSVLQVGQETMYRVRASANITNGQVVMFAGVSGENILAAPANISTPGFQNSYIMGIATQDIAVNQPGYVTVFGKVRGVNTQAYPVGTILWYDPTSVGGWTATEPAAPGPKVQIAAVLKQNNTDGILQVRITNNPRLQDISDVSANTASTNNYLRYNGSIWQSTALDISNDTSPTLGGALDAATFAISNAGAISGTSLNVGTGNVTGGNLVANLIYGTFVGNISGNLVVPGSNTWVIYNNAGNAGASGDFTFNDATNVMTLAGTANITSVNTTGNVAVGGVLSGNASGLTAVPGANVTGTVANATYATSAGSATTATSATTAGTVTGNAQANITSVGTLTSLTVSGNITGGNLNTSGNASAAFFIGNGSQLTGIVTTGTNSFSTINANGTNVVADSSTDTLTFVAGSGMTITANATTDTITFASTGGYGNAEVAAYLPTYTGNLQNATGPIATANTSANLNFGPAGAAVVMPGNLSVEGGFIRTSAAEGRIFNIGVANVFLGGFANTFIGSPTGVQTIYGNVSMPGNLAVTNRVTAGSFLTTGNANVSNLNAVAVSTNTLTASGNLTVANLNANTNVTASVVSAPTANLGNISTANITFNAGNTIYIGGIDNSSLTNDIRIGTASVANALSDDSIHIGRLSGSTGNAMTYVIGIGAGTHDTGPVGEGAIALGQSAARENQAGNAIAIGVNAGAYNQGERAIAVGLNAGFNTGLTPGQGAGSIAIGAFTGNSAAANSITLDASGTISDYITATNAGFYVRPVRNDTGNVTNGVYYNTTTKELTYGPAGSGGGNSFSTISANGTNIVADSSSDTLTIAPGNGIAITGDSGNDAILISSTVTQYSDANVAAYLPTYTGNLAGGNLIITGGSLYGNASGLTAIPGANVTGTVSSATTAGTVTGNAQANITSVGTLTSLTVSGNANVAGNLQLDGGFIRSNAATVGLFNFNTTTLSMGSSSTSMTLGGSAGNITLNGNVGVGAALNSTGNVTAPYFIGDGSQLTNLPGGGGNSFSTIDANGTSIIADSASDTLTLTPGSGITITGNATTDAVTISSTITQYSDSNVAAYLPTYTGNLANATGNIGTASNAANLNIGPTGSARTVVNGNLNIEGGFIRTSATDAFIFNINSGNLSFGGAAANIYFGGSFAETQVYLGKNVQVAGNLVVNGSNVQLSGNTATVTSANYQIGYRDVPQVSLSGNVTLGLTDAGKHFYRNGGSDVTITIPDNANVAFPTGTEIQIWQTSTANIDLVRGTGVLLYQAGNSTSADKRVTSYGEATLIKLSSDTWMVTGTNITGI